MNLDKDYAPIKCFHGVYVCRNKHKQPFTCEYRVNGKNKIEKYSTAKQLLKEYPTWGNLNGHYTPLAKQINKGHINRKNTKPQTTERDTINDNIEKLKNEMKQQELKMRNVTTSDTVSNDNDITEIVGINTNENKIFRTTSVSNHMNSTSLADYSN